MEAPWSTILIRVWAQDSAESELIIRIIRADDEGAEEYVVGSIEAALDRVRRWLTDKADGIDSDAMNKRRSVDEGGTADS